MWLVMSYDKATDKYEFTLDRAPDSLPAEVVTQEILPAVAAFVAGAKDGESCKIIKYAPTE